MNAYFIVLDEARVKGSSTPKYDLMFGCPDEAIGSFQKSSKTIKSLLQKVPTGETVYRTFLQRTDGKTGKKVLR